MWRAGCEKNLALSDLFFFTITFSFVDCYGLRLCLQYYPEILSSHEHFYVYYTHFILLPWHLLSMDGLHRLNLKKIKCFPMKCYAHWEDVTGVVHNRRDTKVYQSRGEKHTTITSLYTQKSFWTEPGDPPTQNTR